MKIHVIVDLPEAQARKLVMEGKASLIPEPKPVVEAVKEEKKPQKRSKKKC